MAPGSLATLGRQRGCTAWGLVWGGWNRRSLVLLTRVRRVGGALRMTACTAACCDRKPFGLCVEVTDVGHTTGGKRPKAQALEEVSEWDGDVSAPLR